ncbi:MULTISPECIES: hypothetical protein [Fructobacillus]|uniref:Uncharacterized protein n=1 Tax=Fructobacillus cardui TaxID=2893170 RepID=A0ABN9YPV1_9LACO|nr:hypothetical protein [Fructobacillus sp. EFB-N1]KMK52796.1 hypothetical protein FEFB_14970 [Fructobacillus sp. EFB-N1]CAK1232086.1 unnamed protein product [Fructobacillus cardui]
MAKVTFESQPKLTKREAELLEILEEIGLGKVVKSALYDELSDDDLVEVDFDDIAEAYVLGYEEVE